MFKTDISSLDIWSIPHFLSGFLIGFPFLQYHFGFVTTFFIVLAASVVFETIEISLDVKESFRNKIVDLSLGLSAYVVVYYFFLNFSRSFNYYLLFISSIIYLSVVIPGWLKYIRIRS